ncbi:MAG TPA: RsmD family RNA methyltransferase [Chitinophagaceae bacterium]|nr:RsmD family RNA methyltransferase [Chitinophagaceae bacterium]
MRIIGGSMGGRRVHPPAQMPHTRPTTDIAKEGLFNVLENNMELEGITTLDLFGGTGSISYELASRGAANITIVEKDEKMHAFITQNIAALKIEHCRVVKSDVFRFIEQCTDQFNFIFAGPPYALATIDTLPVLIAEKNLLLPGGWFVLEHTPRNNYEKYALYKTSRHYGTTIFSIFVNSQ